VDILDCHTSNFSRIRINIKFKCIFKINIVNFLIIHGIIDFNGDHHKFFGWILKDYGFVMDFEMTTLHFTQKNEKCGFIKYVKILSK
jgi:hypothetical protein